MMVNLLDDSNFHRQTAVMIRLIEMIIQNPVFGIFCIISMLVHPTGTYTFTFYQYVREILYSEQVFVSLIRSVFKLLRLQK
jgi:hypothetical protein